MTVALANRMTITEFLAWANAQSSRSRYELMDGYPQMMAPERLLHVKTKLAVAMALVEAARQSDIQCHVLPDGATVRVDEYTAFEPDALVYCGEELPDNDIIVDNPVVVIEVLSPSTAHRDAVVKLQDYFRVDSIYHYLIVDPEMRTLIHHQRDDERIATAIMRDGELNLIPPGLCLQVSDLFSGY